MNKEDLIHEIIYIYDLNNAIYVYDSLYNSLNTLTIPQLLFYEVYIDKKNLKRLSNEEYDVEKGEYLPITNEGAEIYSTPEPNLEPYYPNYPAPFFSRYVSMGSDTLHYPRQLPIHTYGYPYLRKPNMVRILSNGTRKPTNPRFRTNLEAATIVPSQAYAKAHRSVGTAFLEKNISQHIKSFLKPLKSKKGGIIKKTKKQKTKKQKTKKQNKKTKQNKTKNKTKKQNK
jgi:hypothetical protein